MNECPRQKAFIKHLDELLYLHEEATRDRFSVDESYRFMEEFSQNKQSFVNLWCPTFKQDEEL